MYQGIPDFPGISTNAADRIYRTGDLGRMNTDGEIVHLVGLIPKSRSAVTGWSSPGSSQCSSGTASPRRVPPS